MDYKTIKWKWYVIGAFVALQPSYIHPDEHFQSLEMLITRFLGNKGTTPWEFETSNAARSYVPLYLFYGPLLYILTKVIGVTNPMTILSFVRLQNYLLYTVVVERFLKGIGRVNKSFTGFLISSSYITWVYQSHTFSNSIETIILLLTLQEFHFLLKNKNSNNYLTSISLGFVITLGIFNRMTFPAFIALPSLKVFFQYFLTHFRSFFFFLFSLCAFSACFVYIDTISYNSNNLIIAPLNNLLYNMNIDNLKLHGLHHRYTHILINMPQMLGPSLILILVNMNPNFRSIKVTIPFLSILSAMLFLSVFQHQELRFIIPIVPLCLLFATNRKWKLFIKIWLAFNAVMAILMGMFHQTGVILALQHFYAIDKTERTVDIWWKTYSPPTWMYMSNSLTVSTTTITNGTETIEDIPTDIFINHVIDLKGCDVELLRKTLSIFTEDNVHVNIIAPSSVKTELMMVLSEKPAYTFDEIYHTYSHLDLDHFNANDLSTFIPGLSIYNINKTNKEKSWTSFIDRFKN